MLLLLVLAAVQLTHIVDFIIIMPLGPVFREEMDLSPSEFGAVVSAYTISAGIAGLLAARFLDRFDRKKTLLGLYAGFIMGTLFCALAPSYPFLLAARSVAGAFGGIVAAMVLAIVGDAFPYARRGIAMGVVMSAFSVASIVGVPLGLALAELDGWRSTFTVLGGLSTAVLALAYAALPSLRGHLARDPGPAASSWEVLTAPNHLRAFILSSAIVFSTFMIVPHLPSFLEGNVGVRQTELKYMYLCGGLATLLTTTMFGRLADRFGKLPVFRVLAFITAAAVLFVTSLPAGLALALVLTVTTVYMVAASGRMVPAMALITASAAPACRGSFMSFNAAVQQFAAGLATLIAGFLVYEAEGRALGGFWLVGLLSAVATASTLVLAGRLRKDPRGDLAPDSTAVEPDPSSIERESAEILPRLAVIPVPSDGASRDHEATRERVR
jgi:predicted MFS family arabinose efflux permease